MYDVTEQVKVNLHPTLLVWSLIEFGRTHSGGGVTLPNLYPKMNRRYWCGH